ncbi:hypothetical protein [Bradyrhizobium sp. 1(2017)]|uniref:hypothetical protein n=1 Tax=Bradyrhizobium sp. 1(2017) TaxID=1404888 RepID=UPI00140F4678|nr:hypothetical protein [Bradyrhizobium sp. 1(2017)]QIO36059.1 hypothetical protein HAP40_31725 [Bradyrhizobium sp. 1(2017)]
MKSYEKCLQENKSSIVNWNVISAKCIEKLATPVPVESVGVGYKEDYETYRNDQEGMQLDKEHALFSWKRNVVIAKPGEYSITDTSYVATFSAENFLLTGVSAVIQLENGEERTITASDVSPAKSLSAEALPSVRVSDFGSSPQHTQCSSTNLTNCISIRVISANGFEIAVD